MSTRPSFGRNRRAVLRATMLGAAAFAAVGRSHAQSPTREIAVERVSVVSARPFEAVVSAFESSIGRPDFNDFMKKLSKAQTFEDVKKIVQRAVGKSGLMEFGRFDLGFVIGKEAGRRTNSLRFLVGNPLIMDEMAKHVPDAGSYAPVTILIDQRADGVHLSYDRMASLLAPYANADAQKVARDLDAKVENILRAAAG
jgi:uncharacterized protein (DUF302 family)